VLDSIKSFFAASEPVTRDQFRLFVSNQAQAHSDLKALEWVPRVTREQRAQFERELRGSGLTERGIWQRNARGEAVPATDRSDYFPVDYFEPRQGNESALGYDEYPGQARRAALEAALATGHATATSRVRLVQETGDEWGTLVVAPVFRGVMDYPTREERAAHLLGYAEIVIRNGDFARAAFGDIGATGLRLRLLDSTVPDQPQLLYESGAPGALKPSQIAMDKTVPVTVAERHWTLEFLLPADYLVAHRSWQAWGLLAVGLLITGLLGMLILVLIARQAKVEELVLARTAELKAAEQKLAGYARELERSNAELEQFAYVASHDLQAPLRSIVGFGQILEKDYRGRLDADADTYIRFMVNSSLQMQGLIRDLLAFSRIGRERSADGLADCERVLAEVEQRLHGLIREHRAVVTHDPLPTVQCAQLELGQVLQNLIGNAIKFQVPGRQPLVHIGALREGGQWRLSVRDNGIGIEARYHERIFQMFQRLHTADKYEGTGIGLAICRKIVERHGGRLWVESEPGQGSVFHFTLGAAGPS
jgi:signal transduction histidine kinase